MEGDPGTSHRWRGFARWMLNGGIVLLGASVAFARLPWDAQRTIWAEDGGIFLNDALNGTGWAGIFSPYEGYLHVIPRLGANLVVSLFAVGNFGLAMNFASCLVVSLVALLVFYLSKPFSDSLLVRLCWASLTILVAPGPLETLANFANVHWYLLWLTPWLLLKAARSRTEGILLFVVSLLVSLTEILSVMFLPLFFYGLRDKSKWFARGGLITGIVCQVATTIAFPRSPSSGYPVNVQSVIEGWFLNSSSALLYGSSFNISNLVRSYGPLPVVFAAVPFFLVFTFIMWKGKSSHRILATIMVAASIGTWAATQVVNPQPFFDYASFTDAEWGGFFLSRYSTVPSMFLLALLPLAAAVLLSFSRAAWSAVLGCFLVLQLVFFFPTVVSRSEGPVWSEGVRAGQEACLKDPGLVASGIQIAPRGWFADKVNISCNRLLER
ncbi:hypothetical protein QF031_001320 [Pseudarthrobacter defluvii]|uniref:hypothetical protein n=1 Tax=Pseudarthrobacter defluvii TaxID=410837 RepID=UPI00277F22F3|nr:hypothetical protein [Pseudarthrobacter defluvii]MDQ0768571.1 hypothetical protein [Pseudarthrobacter defluvii]